MVGNGLLGDFLKNRVDAAMFGIEAERVLAGLNVVHSLSCSHEIAEMNSFIDGNFD